MPICNLKKLGHFKEIFGTHEIDGVLKDLCACKNDVTCKSD